MANPYTCECPSSARAAGATRNTHSASIANVITARSMLFIRFSSCSGRVAAPSMLRRVGLLPGADVLAPLVENPLVIALEDLVLRLRVEFVEHRPPHVENRVVRVRLLGRDGVRAEQEPIGILVEHVRRFLDRRGARDRVL